MSPEYNEPTPTTVIETEVKEVPTIEQESSEVRVSSLGQSVIESLSSAVETKPTNDEVLYAEALSELTRAASINDWSEDRIDSVKQQIEAKFQIH